MSLLLSFCNQEFTPELALLLIDPEQPQRARWIEYPLVDGYLSCNGIARHRDLVYVLIHARDGRTDLLVFDAKLAWLATCPLASVRSGHSLIAVDDTLYAVSSRDNAVVALRLADDGLAVEHEQCFWRHPDCADRQGDQVHLNSIASCDGAMVVTCFGPKSGSGWKSARGGLCLEIGSGRTLASGLVQPHTARLLDRRLLVCGSGDSSLWASEPGDRTSLSRRRQLSGYLRGLELWGGRLFVGRSGYRRISKSTGTPNVEVDSDLGAALLELTPELELRREIDLRPFGSEVYDLMALPELTPEPADAVARRVESLERRLTAHGSLEIEELQRQLNLKQAQVAGLHSSASYRLARLLSWPLRRLFGR
jgi:hypothetical protein